MSFIIPVYDADVWLHDCISSVLAQTEVDIEVICINDGSTDGSLAILQRFARNDPRVRVIDQPNSGQSVARNVGLDAATGRYIIYLDSDDYWPYDALRTLVRRADESELDVLLFDCIAFRDGAVDEKVWRRYSTYYQRSQAYAGVRRGIELLSAMRERKDYRPHVGLYMSRTSFVRAVGLRFIPGIVHQDNPYTFCLLLNAPRAAHEQMNVYARRLRPGSTITTLTADRSARGYYLSFVAMSREVERLELPAEAAPAVRSIVCSVYEAAQNQFNVIPQESLEQIQRLDRSADAQALFAALMEGRRLNRQGIRNRLRAVRSRLVRGRPQ